MPLRDLLCVLEATEKPAIAALQQAAALARGQRAQLSVLVSAPEIVVPRGPFNVAMITGMVQNERAKIRTRADALARTAQEVCAQAGVTAEVEVSIAPFGDLMLLARSRALCRDLIVLNRPGTVIERSEALFEEILFGSGRPVLVATPERGPVEQIGKIVLAWDGSAHAARALNLALALFPAIKEVHVAVVSGEKDLSDTVPGGEIAQHIGRHGITASVADLPMEKQSVAATIDGYASKIAADLIVMGGFGHSRLREFVLGGVTRALSQTAHTALFLAH